MVEGSGVVPLPSLSPGAAGITISALVAELARALAAARIERGRQEARDIVAAVLDVPRFWPSLHAGAVADANTAERARGAVLLRTAGAPFAYAVGRTAFRHLTLLVDERVLIPRQETEALVDAALEGVTHAGGIAVDVGTGCGAIALALATEARFDRVIGTDVSLGAIAVARANATRMAGTLGTPVELRHGSLLAPVRDVRARLVISNPPYIAHEEAAGLPVSVRDWEPPVALYSGMQGMATTRALIQGAARILETGGVLAVELDARRASLAAELALADSRYRDVTIKLDLAGQERILLATRKEA